MFCMFESLSVQTALTEKMGGGGWGGVGWVVEGWNSRFSAACWENDRHIVSPGLLLIKGTAFVTACCLPCTVPPHFFKNCVCVWYKGAGTHSGICGG